MLSKLLALVPTAAIVLSAAEAPLSELPVTQVTLYKHGVAHFERSGELKPGSTVRLDFKPAEMNDVLKSLTVNDRNGGKVAGVRYDSSDPVEKRLADFPFAVGTQGSLATFLDQIKGAHIEMRIGPADIAGTIVSARVLNLDHETIVLLLDAGEIHSYDLSSASSLKLSDPKLQNQLRGYLGVLNLSRSKDRRSVYIDSLASANPRNIVTSYMTPAPVWKSSYRLLFSPSGDPTLEGWAIIDNTSGDDWNNVRLSVVSGKPVSFISNLYEPRYVNRPVAELTENQAAPPVVYAGAMDRMEESNAKKAMAAPAAPSVAGGRFNRSDGTHLGTADAPLNGRNFTQLVEVAPSSLAATATGQQAGELFEYSFASPVTVKQGESAMLPFLQQKISARKLLVYSENYGLNPRDAAELSNNTGKTLDGGPITVYDAGAYAGEALVETLPMSDKRLISYGVDLGTRVTTAFDSSNAVVREVHFKRGALTTRSAFQETKTYTIKNVDAKAKTLVIEHAQRSGYTLLDRKASETTPSAYRFEVPLAASGTATVPVKEERVYDQSTSISSLTPDVLTTYIQNKSLSDAARRQLEQIAQKKNQVVQNEAALKNATDEFNNLAQDQGRIRSNIESLNRVSGQQNQVQQYALQLATTETRLTQLRDTQSDLRKRKTALDAELAALIDKAEF